METKRKKPLVSLIKIQLMANFDKNINNDIL